MEQTYDFSKGHPVDTDLIEYNSTINFLTNSNGKINYYLVEYGSVSRLHYFKPFNWFNDYVYIQNFVYPTNFSSVNPSTELLSFIRTIHDQTGYDSASDDKDYKKHTKLDNHIITKKEDNYRKYPLHPDVFSLNSLSNSSIKKNVIVEEIDNYYLIKTGEVGTKIRNSKGKEIEKTIIPEKTMYIKKDDYNKGISASKYGEDYDEINKEVIVALEFELYQNLEGDFAINNNCISRLKAVYKSEFLNVYNRIYMSAEVDNTTQTINPIFNGMNKLKISDIKYYTGIAVGDNDYTGGKNIFIKCKDGYALSGISYIKRDGYYWGKQGTMPISQVVFAFDSIYEPNKPTLYYHLNSGQLSEHLLSNPLDTETYIYSFNMDTNRNKKMFISTFDVFYAPQPKEENLSLAEEIINYVQNVIPIIMISLINFPYGILYNFFNPKFWETKWDIQYQHSETYFSGVKGFMSVQTISLKTNLVYDWLKDYEPIRSCDTVPNNLYEPNTVEEIYGKYVKDYYTIDFNTPSDKCKSDILYPYCNAYIKKEYMVILKKENSFIKFQVGTRHIILNSNDLKSNIIQSINSLLPLSDVKCFDINTNIFEDTLVFTFLFYNDFHKKLPLFIYDENNIELDIELIEEKYVLEENRCRYFCELSDINCDATISKFCSHSKNYDKNSIYYEIKFPSQIQLIEQIKFVYGNKNILLKNKSDLVNQINYILPPGTKLIDTNKNEFIDKLIFIFNKEIKFKIFYNENEIPIEKIDIDKSVIDEPYMIKNIISFQPQYIDINLPISEKILEVYVPNQKRIFYKDTEVCGCYFARNKEYIQNITKFYDNIKTKYKTKLETEKDSINKQKLQDEITYIDYLKRTIVLNDSEESLKLALELQLKDPKMLDSYKTECSMPSCKKSSYKLFNMKKTQCNEDQICIGKGYAFPEGNETRISCNMEKGLENLRCTLDENNNVQPKIMLIPDFTNFQKCMDIYKTSIQYDEVDRPSYCKYADIPRPVGCIEKNMKYVHDIVEAQYPPWREDLCPPPTDKLPLGYKNPDLRYEPDKCGKKQEKVSNQKYIIVAISIVLLFLIVLFFLIKKILK